MYDVDGFETSQADVDAMHAAGIKVVCYLSAGTYERYRPDADQFPATLLGAKNGWPGERRLTQPPSRDLPGQPGRRTPGQADLSGAGGIRLASQPSPGASGAC